MRMYYSILFVSGSLFVHFSSQTMDVSRDEALHAFPTKEEMEQLRREAVEKLLVENGDVNAFLKESQGGSLLIYDDVPLLLMARHEDDLDLCEELLRRGADPNTRAKGSQQIHA